MNEITEQELTRSYHAGELRYIEYLNMLLFLKQGNQYIPARCDQGYGNWTNQIT